MCCVKLCPVYVLCNSVPCLCCVIVCPVYVLCKNCVLSMCCVIVCPVYVLCNSVSCLLLYSFGCDVCIILKIKKSLNFMIKTKMTEINYYLCRCFYTWYICVIYWTVLVVKSCLSLLFE
jgi:hypothetical protein